MTATIPADLGPDIGSGWPDPSEPGVPAQALHDGFHWMAWPRTGVVTIGEWAPDIWLWVISYLGEFADPNEMQHLNYIGPCAPPGRGTPQ
jgi:hypothetical protein